MSWDLTLGITLNPKQWYQWYNLRSDDGSRIIQAKLLWFTFYFTYNPPRKG